MFFVNISGKKGCPQVGFFCGAYSTYKGSSFSPQQRRFSAHFFLYLEF